jgi:hypothetical protein
MDYEIQSEFFGCGKRSLQNEIPVLRMRLAVLQSRRGASVHAVSRTVRMQL